LDIKNFLQSSYSKENFIEFIYDKFYGFEENDSEYKLPFTETEKNHIQKYKFLGQVELDDNKEIGFFEVITTEKTDIENNRVSLNNILKNKASAELLDGAIAIFYNPLKTDVYRLSFIKFSYDNNNKEEVTNLKRFTYVLGKNIPIKTAYNQLKNLKYPTLTELEEAFSVEKISKEFFTKYKNLYHRLVEDIVVVNKETITDEEKLNQEKSYEYIKDEKTISFYIKKLLGRIVFLYFVQKKGWLNNDKKFLSNLFYSYTKENPNINFYDKMLETLFFNALNTKRDEDKITLGGKEYAIPYLNGGLFEEDEYDKVDIAITNNDLKLILELFDTYNFTIIEDTPHDSEIAIDPEMLGKVFEDLLEDRKEKGTFYTPREIVHYMCQQSIINYLANFYNEDSLEDINSLILEEKTDTKFIKDNAKDIKTYLDNIKVLDPAIGSGAFPMGMLHEIVTIFSNLNKMLSNDEIANIKRKVIENSIYGIDIENSAVEIAKLRFWLSIVVDEEKPSPLPNLKYKIMVGNSLIETINGFDPLKQHGNTKEIKFLKEKFHRYFNATNNQEKEKINEEIKRNIHTILSSAIKRFDIQPRFNMDKRGQKEYENNLEKHNLLKDIIEDYSKYNYTTKLFLYKIYFKEVFDDGGFDIVIGNPPYIKEYTNKSAFDGTRHLECYQGKMDIWYLFGCKGINLLKNNGILSFIATNNWISNAGASKFRNKVLTTSTLQEFIDFGDYKVFETAGIQTMILITKKMTNKGKYQCQYSKIINKNIEKKNLISFLEKKEDKRFSIFKSYITPKDLIDKPITFLESNISFILDKIDKNRNFNLSDNEVIQGIVGAPDKAFIIKEKEFNCFNEIEKSYLKLFHTNCNRFYTSPTNKYIFYTTKKNITNIEKLDNLKNKLSEYREQLDNRREVKSGQIKYYHLQWPRNELFFTKGSKIICNTRTALPSATYEESEFYASRALNIIKTDRINLKFLTALINSKISHFWLKYMGKLTGDLLQIDKSQLINIPIKYIEDAKPFEILVDYIRYLKTLKTDDRVDEYSTNEHISQYFEDILDGMFFELYFEKELNDKNIRFIEFLDDLIPITELEDNEKKESISNIYINLNETRNPVRNNLMLLHVELDFLKSILKV